MAEQDLRSDQVKLPLFDEAHFINRNTKIDDRGIVIICPCCAAQERIYSLEWSTRRCPSCNQLDARGDYFFKPEPKEPDR